MKIISMIKGILYGRSLYRIYFNDKLKNLRLSGNILDIGSGANSMYSHFDNLRGLSIDSIGLKDDRNKPSIEFDLENGLPILNKKYDFIFMFNILEHIYNHKLLIKHCKKYLNEDGKIYFAVPFSYKIHRDPEDYLRFTDTYLNRIFNDAGFNSMKIYSLGYVNNILAFSHYQHQVPKWARFFSVVLFIIAYFMDSVLLYCLGDYLKEQYPIAYWGEVSK